MLLEVRDLSLFYGDAQALDGVGLSVAEGEIVAIVGANGAGKTSLIRAIAGMHKPSGGSILYRGTDITGWPSHKVCDLGIGQVAEGRQIFPTMTVMENLETGAMLPRAKMGRKDRLEYVLTLFPRLSERAGQLCGTLSGGEQQMVAIGRCLMGRPDIIMFDEPSLGLSPALVTEVFRIVRALHEDKMTIVLVEQNVAASLKLADRAYVLENGRIALEGSGAELQADERVRKAYMGL